MKTIQYNLIHDRLSKDETRQDTIITNETIQYMAIQCKPRHDKTIQQQDTPIYLKPRQGDKTPQANKTQLKAIQDKTTQYNTTQDKTTQHKTTERNTTPRQYNPRQ